MGEHATNKHTRRRPKEAALISSFLLILPDVLQTTLSIPPTLCGKRKGGPEYGVGRPPDTISTVTKGDDTGAKGGSNER